MRCRLFLPAAPVPSVVFAAPVAVVPAVSVVVAVKGGQRCFEQALLHRQIVAAFLWQTAPASGKRTSLRRAALVWADERFLAHSLGTMFLTLLEVPQGPPCSATFLTFAACFDARLACCNLRCVCLYVYINVYWFVCKDWSLSVIVSFRMGICTYVYLWTKGTFCLRKWCVNFLIGLLISWDTKHPR